MEIKKFNKNIILQDQTGNLLGDILLQQAHIFDLQNKLLKQHSTGNTFVDLGFYLGWDPLLVFTVYGDPLDTWPLLCNNEYKINLCAAMWRYEGFKLYGGKPDIVIQKFNEKKMKTYKYKNLLCRTMKKLLLGSSSAQFPQQ